MSRVVKWILLAIAALAASAVLVNVLLDWSFQRDQRNFQAAANPCERACIQDSGGIDSCRKECASHPMTYGPGGQVPSR